MHLHPYLHPYLRPHRLLAVCLLTLVLLTACGGHDDGGSASGTQVTTTITSAGGTVNGPDGVQLVVPAGAVSSPVTIRIARSSSGAPAVPTFLGPTGQVYEITPHGQQFAQPVTLRFPAPADTNTQAPKILVAPPGGEWQGAAARLASGMLEIERFSLSFFVLPIPYACSSVDTAKDRYACYWFGLGAPFVTAVPSSALAQPLITDNVGLSFRSAYYARPDCGGSRMQAWRQHIRTDGTREAQTLVLDQPLKNIGESGDANFVFGPASSPEFQVTAADNGWIVFFFKFSCQVASWPTPASNVGDVGFKVNITSAAPTAPAIAAADPADLTVFQGDPATFSVSPSGTAPLSYQWKRNGVAIAGATGNRYTLASASQAADNGATFSVDVSSPWGAATSRAATLTVDVAVAPAIGAEEPIDQTVVEGFPASFSVSPTGTPPFSYQWKRGGVAIAGANTSSYTLASTTRVLDDGATFSVDVRNLWGSATSRTAMLTVKPVATGGGFNVTTIASRDQGGVLLPFWNPNGGMAVDAAGNVFLGDGNRIRQFTASGITSIYAGSGAEGATDGPAATATFGFLNGMALDAAGNLYVADTFAIRKVDTAGNVSTLAGSGTRGYVDGPAGTAQFMGPRGVAVDAAGNIYVADQGNSGADLDYAVRKITPTGAVSTVAGGNGLGHADGRGSVVKFNFPYGLCVGTGGALYTAEAGNRDIRKIALDGTVTTLAGDPSYRGSVAVDGTGSAALFPGPQWLACDGSGNLFVSDSGSSVSLRKVTAGGVVTTVVGGNAAGPADGPGLSVALAQLTAIAVAADGSLYAVDGARLIRIVP
jgi:sugar lactone lactonase YvrE